MTTDQELLRQYARKNSQEAFTEVVRRHVNLVYGTALRQLCGNAALAGDVTQVVFTALATKAGSRSKINNLAAWLFATTRFTVSHTVRAERRRQNREQIAYSMHSLVGEPTQNDPPELPPGLLDEALEVLDGNEREADLLRFLEGHSFPSISRSLEVSEDAARMRVTRALERIKAHFSSKGIHSSAAALGVALENQVVAAPSGLAASISLTAHAEAATAAATASSKVGIASIMSTSKTAMGLAWAIAAMGIGVSGYLYHVAAAQSAEVVRLTAERDKLQGEVDLGKQQLLAAIQRARQSEQDNVNLQGKLKEAASASGAKASRTPAKGLSPEIVDRLTKLKPQLEAGLPIKGAVVVLVDGKPVQRPVEFVMGKETRIEAVDDGTYVIMPSLNEDGTVKYSISLERKNPNSGSNQIEKMPFVTQTPWGGFTIGGGEGRVFAFDPDTSEP